MDFWGVYPGASGRVFPGMNESLLSHEFCLWFVANMSFNRPCNGTDTRRGNSLEYESQNLPP